MPPHGCQILRDIVLVDLLKVLLAYVRMCCALWRWVVAC